MVVLLLTLGGSTFQQVSKPVAWPGTKTWSARPKSRVPEAVVTFAAHDDLRSLSASRCLQEPACPAQTSLPGPLGSDSVLFTDLPRVWLLYGARSLNSDPNVCTASSPTTSFLSSFTELFVSACVIVYLHVEVNGHLAGGCCSLPPLGSPQ